MKARLRLFEDPWELVRQVYNLGAYLSVMGDIGLEPMTACL